MRIWLCIAPLGNLEVKLNCAGVCVCAGGELWGLELPPDQYLKSSALAQCAYATLPRYICLPLPDLFATPSRAQRHLLRTSSIITKSNQARARAYAALILASQSTICIFCCCHSMISLLSALLGITRVLMVLFVIGDFAVPLPERWSNHCKIASRSYLAISM